MSAADLLNDLAEVLHMRDALNNAGDAPAEWKERKARSILAHTIDIMRDVCGPDVLSLAYGQVASGSRADVLHKAADRLEWPKMLFAGAGVRDAASFEALADECDRVARGDKPDMLAKLPVYRRDIRLAAAKLQALRWDEYLNGYGVEAAKRHAVLSEQFGQEWDTIYRWRKEVAAIWGDDIMSSQLLRYRSVGERHKAENRMVAEQEWRVGVGRAGRIYRRQAGYAQRRSE